MSAENGKVCCNCRHNIRKKDDKGAIYCECDIDNTYIDYIKCFEGWCKHWARDKWEAENDRGREKS